MSYASMHIRFRYTQSIIPFIWLTQSVAWTLTSRTDLFEQNLNYLNDVN